jgi:hypothetical protein
MPRGAALVFAALMMAAPLSAQTRPAPKAAKIVTLSTAQLRARLTAAAQKLSAMEKRPPRPLGRVLAPLDAKISVRRADGATQIVTGNQWARLSAGLSKPADARREEVAQARRIAQSQIRALDEWSQSGFVPATNAKQIVTDLVAAGEIRVGPLWWQSAITNAWKTFTDALIAFLKWITSLLPKPATGNVGALPFDKWLWLLFYIVVVAIIATIAWFLFRAFGGKWGRRTKSRVAELEGEDAQLLLLPPDELRLRAEEYAARGEFREALRHRYLALLLQLDARGVWRYDARRTNWEHIAGLRRSESKTALVAPLSDLTRRFDRVRYGGAPCDQGQWADFNSDTQNLENQSGAPARELVR